MPLFSHFGKLWIKIAFATALISWIGIEVVIQITLLDSITNTRTEIQRDLEHVAALASHGISGNDHNAAIGNTPEARTYFNRIRDHMRAMRRQVGFSENWYTLLPNSNDTTYFGVMTHSTSFQGDMYVFQDAGVRKIFERVLAEKMTLSTDIYKSANGIWLSALSPIINSQGNAVAVLEVDIRYEEYLAREDAIRTRAAWIRAVGFVIGGLLGMLMGYVIAKPLRVVSEAVKQVADNDFRGSVKLPFLLRLLPDETTQLIINFNQMASRLDTTLNDLLTAKERLQTLDHAKTVFLQFIAHELRTPLNGLKPLNMLEEFIYDQDAKDILHSAVASTDRLQKFSLAAERYIQALTHTPDFSESLDIADVLPYIIDECRLAAQAYTVEFTNSNEGSLLPACIPYNILERILAPILNNAVKFSPEGCSIATTLSVADESIIITVRDPGYGFPPDVAERIFEPFFVASIEHHSQGTGVSLSIAKVLARHYRGELTAQSDGLGCGSIFTIVLPLDNIGQIAGGIPVSVSDSRT